MSLICFAIPNTIFWVERKRERKRETETDREAERQRQTERDTERDRETETSDFRTLLRKDRGFRQSLFFQPKRERESSETRNERFI